MEANEATELVQRDIEVGFGDVFEPARDGFRLIEAFTSDGAMTNERFTAVPWEYACRHTGEFFGIRPTLQDLTIHGVTIVAHPDEGDEAVFHRFIDWATVMAQLGIPAAWRPTIDEIPRRPEAAEPS